MSDNPGNILTRSQLQYYMSEALPLDGRLFISPLIDRNQIGDTSIDLRLGHYFLVAQPSRLGVLDPITLHYDDRGWLADSYRGFRVPFGHYFTLHPGDSAQVGTLEYLGIPPNLQGLISLRASVSDIPLSSRTTQVHPGHKGIVALTLTSHSRFSIRLYPGMRIAELQLQFTHEPLLTPRPSRHHRKTRPDPPRLHEDEDLRYLGPTVEPIIIGVVSTIAAGRTTAVSRLVNSFGFQAFSLTEGIREEAHARGLSYGRSDLQTLGTSLRTQHGNAVLAERLRHSPAWLSCRSNLVVVDGFKHKEEVLEFRKQRKFSLLGITADQQVRWDRVRERRRPGEPVDFREFQEQDEIDRGLRGATHSQHTDRLLEEADCLIENNKTRNEFLSELDKYVENWINSPYRQEA